MRPVTRLKRAGAIVALAGVLSLPGACAAPGPAPAAVAADKFELNCLACHGADLEGIEGLGANLAFSGFVGRKTVPELVAFLQVGRMPGDPESVSGRAMPGFSWLPEADLIEIATYVKSKHRP
jgi:mono/diheme cytochrome c family protein